jgi:hypothetical protein
MILNLPFSKGSVLGLTMQYLLPTNTAKLRIEKATEVLSPLISFIIKGYTLIVNKRVAFLPFHVLMFLKLCNSFTSS